MSAFDVQQYLRQHIRTVPDWPAPGVQFRDITPLLQDPRVFRVLIDAFVHRYMDKHMRPDVVAGLDARGFILGAVVAYELQVGFVPIRKKGKLPFTTVEETYELEYGSATVELHTDAVRPGDRVLLIDDLIATGGTMMAGKKLLEKLGAEVMEGAAIVDLPELGGSERLRASGLKLYTLVDFAPRRGAHRSPYCVPLRPWGRESGISVSSKSGRAGSGRLGPERTATPGTACALGRAAAASACLKAATSSASMGSNCGAAVPGRAAAGAAAGAGAAARAAAAGGGATGAFGGTPTATGSLRRR